MNASQRHVSHAFRYGAHTMTLETGELARQATGSALASVEGTVVLATVVASRNPSAEKDFLPLTVNFQERFYAGGRIPGGFFKREGRPSERETLTSRLIDRPIRPLFPDGFRCETQVVVTVLSANPDVDADIPSLVAVAAALRFSGVPFNGPLAAARVGYIRGNFVLNPTRAQLALSDLDLVVAGTRNAVLMVESEAKLLSEKVMLDAVMYGHRQMQDAIDAIEQLASRVEIPPFEWQPPSRDTALAERVATLATDQVAAAYRITERSDRIAALQSVREQVKESIRTTKSDATWTPAGVSFELAELEYRTMRMQLLDTGHRVDGRSLNRVRPIQTRVDLLPRAHGSALFQRGETQALVALTLGTTRDAQLIDAMEGDSRDPFLFHYNFPPYCVGETGFMSGPKRREIGHGRLAKRGVQAVMPSQEEFRYVVRLVSEITESNGSSSMASVCGSSLALMAAGVPIKAPVAGIAMGLVKEGERFAVLTDILGDEDHLGDMDFKVAGTAEGITALQMDIKIDGITQEIMQIALERAREGRLHILAEMAKTIRVPRTEMSPWAPRLYTLKVPTDRIRDVIGKGGATIRALIAETGTEIDVADDGTITVAATSSASAEAALQRIRLITEDIEEGAIYEGRVVKLMDFGAFVSILPGRDGLVHISQLSTQRVERVADAVSEGDVVRVKVLEVDRQGRIRLSIKALLEERPEVLVRDAIGSS